MCLWPHFLPSQPPSPHLCAAHAPCCSSLKLCWSWSWGSFGGVPCSGGRATEDPSRPTAASGSPLSALVPSDRKYISMHADVTTRHKTLYIFLFLNWNRFTIVAINISQVCTYFFQIKCKTVDLPHSFRYCMNNSQFEFGKFIFHPTKCLMVSFFFHTMEMCKKMFIWLIHLNHCSFSKRNLEMLCEFF